MIQVLARRSRTQGGTVMVLSALLMMILIAFLGLVVDGGEISSAARQSQNAADGAALAAAYDILNNGAGAGYSLSTHATVIADEVAVKNGISSSELTLTYLDSSDGVTSTPTSVEYVKADVTHSFATLFLPVIGINSASISNHAKVELKATPPPCAVCVLAGSGVAFKQDGSALNVSGGNIIVNSTSAGAATITTNGSNVTDTVSSGAPKIQVGAGGTGVAGSGGSFSPSVSNGPATVDPLASLAQPPTSRSPSTNYGDMVISDSSQHTLSPGVYGKLEYTGSGKMILNAGTYIVTSDFLINAGGEVDGTAGVTIYLACSGYPTACTSGQSGASANIANNGRVRLYGEAAGGEYAGMVLMSDRNNSSAVSVTPSNNSVVTGSIYAASSPVTIGGNGMVMNSQLIVNTLYLNSTHATTITYNATQNYVPSNTLVLLV